jgi:hypothetical protein
MLEKPLQRILIITTGGQNKKNAMDVSIPGVGIRTVNIRLRYRLVLRIRTILIWIHIRVFNFETIRVPILHLEFKCSGKPYRHITGLSAGPICFFVCCGVTFAWSSKYSTPIGRIWIHFHEGSFGSGSARMIRIRSDLDPVLWSRNFLFPLRLRLSKSFGSGSRAALNVKR